MLILFFTLLLVMPLPPFSPLPLSNPFLSFSVQLYTLGAPQPSSLPASFLLESANQAIIKKPESGVTGCQGTSFSPPPCFWAAHLEASVSLQLYLT